MCKCEWEKGSKEDGGIIRAEIGEDGVLFASFEQEKYGLIVIPIPISCCPFCGEKVEIND
jgi:hypothetical protein